MDQLSAYIADIVEPTFDDFHRNPRSVRHGYLACVAAYHAVDRAAYPRKPANLRKSWGEECFYFKLIDIIAHHFKHVMSDEEKRPPPIGSIPITQLLFGSGSNNIRGFNIATLNNGGIDLHNLYFVVRDAIQFLRQKAGMSPSVTITEGN